MYQARESKQDQTKKLEKKLKKSLDKPLKVWYNKNVKRTRKSPKNQKGITMKKNTMIALVSYLNGNTVDNIAEIKAELEAELNRGAEKAQKNRELYESVKPIVFEGLRVAGVPVTISELYEEIKDKLPEGFGKSKVQYAVTRLWIDELVKTEGKVNTYSLRVE